MPGFGRRDIDRMMKMEVGVIPEDTVAATVVGAAIDRRSATGSGASAVMIISCGAATGGPSAQSVIATMQDSADGSSDWQDIGSVAATLTADDTSAATPNINLVAVRKFIRGEAIVSFTGGSTPSIPVAAIICIGGRE